MRVDDDRLRIRITDDAYALITRERVEFVFKLRTEIVALQIVNLTTETLLLVVHHHTRTPCTEMRIVVSAVEQVVHTALRADGSKESSHTL